MGSPLRYRPKKRSWMNQSAESKPKIQLVNTQSESSTVKSVSSAPADEHKRLLIFHRINELYQEKNQQFSQLMEGVLEITGEALNAEGGSLWLVKPGGSPANRKIECRAAVGSGGDLLVGVKIPYGKGVVGWVAENQRSTMVEDTIKDDRFYSQVDRQKKFDTRTVIASPLVYSGEVIGVLEFVNKQDPITAVDVPFCEKDILLLEDICTPIAMHLNNSFARDKEQKLLKRMESFAELHESFCSTLELKQLLQIVLSKAIQLLDAEVGSLWLLGEGAESEEVICHVADGPTRDKVVGLRVKLGQGIIGWAVDNLEPVIVEDCSQDARFTANIDKKIDFLTRSMVAAPLKVKEEAIGAIQIINKKGEGILFSQEDLELLVLFANSAAMYIKNARLFASENKAKELSALIGISKQITATLDLDSVLMTIVNLASEVAGYDQAAISVHPPGKDSYEIRALSGVEKIDPQSTEIKTLNAIHEKIGAQQKEVMISSRAEYVQKFDAITELKQYLEGKNIEGFYAIVFQDDQGDLGVLSMEFKAKGGLDSARRELLSILISQCTVAIRNATLYTTIPQGNFWLRPLQKMKLWRQKVQQWPRQKQLKVAVLGLSALLAMIFVKIPYYASARIELLPVAVTAYAESQGKVAAILVKESQRVKAGDLLVQLDVSELELQKSQKQSVRAKIASEMIKLQTEDRVAEFKIREKELLSLEAELALMELQISNAAIRSSVDGMVVTQDLDKLIGMPVSYGQELIKIAKQDESYVQFQIPEEDAEGIVTGNRAKFRLYGMPNNSFSEGISLNSVAGEGRQITESDPTRYFTALALVKMNSETGSIRPGMTGKGKVFAGNRSLLYLLLGRPLGSLLFKLFY